MTAAELVARLTGLVKEQADIIKAQAEYLAFFITSLSRNKEACHEKGH